MAPLNTPSGVSRAEPSVIVSPGAYRPKAQMVAPPGAGGVEVEAIILEATALPWSAVLLRLLLAPGPPAVLPSFFI